ncbi:hypothetical protein PHYSODRAFT_358103 [Phytophthora sojae]|uniref:tRNA-dihydrouridine(16/17) synthase [NAD(P)(+)] n=1 Tax=Phytophthora sojae (strain P6497) TaxID=1094619 RepID=G5AIJ1_PHYSP|nr:hypothetical protein PHYSODRAFT_358103 [Phytophthora sojae]EGZ04692.1 hypothetical protein PHYSODRAFT_358103 [Phytophthora sojae]|eukprot:XP_009539892.1 hypothetical protein PHYSODRAFT_358103 [Phytophthora sojae]
MVKLRGYDFYRAIGSPQRIVAPMVDQSELAFRMLCRKLGADCCYTPMLHSRLFAESAEYREKMFERHIQDRPLVVQFCGNDKTVLAAAKMVEGHCDAVDLNLGCPQGIARKGNYGSFLMHDKDTERLTIPVIANGGIETHEDIACCMEATGCDGVISSEGLLENPALFADTNNKPGEDTSFLALARQYLECATLYPAASDKIDLRVHSDLRGALANAKSQDEMVDIVEELAVRLKEAESGNAGPETKKVEYAAETSWYRRHRQGQEKLRRRDSYERCLDTGFGSLFA